MDVVDALMVLSGLVAFAISGGGRRVAKERRGEGGGGASSGRSGGPLPPCRGPDFPVWK